MEEKDYLYIVQDKLHLMEILICKELLVQQLVKMYICGKRLMIVMFILQNQGGAGGRGQGTGTLPNSTAGGNGSINSSTHVIRTGGGGGGTRVAPR